jgi:hypothetical protein
MLQFVIILKALNEVALMALLGQAALYVLAGSRRDSNPIYALLKAVTSPVMKLARLRWNEKSKARLVFHGPFAEPVGAACEPDVKGRKQENADEENTDESADDHDREGPLRIRTDVVRERGGQ